MRTLLASAFALGATVAASAQGYAQGYDYGPASPYSGRPGVVIDQNGAYRGNANNNPYDPNSISNPMGRYGSRSSPDSINNPYGAGNPHSGNRYRVIER